MRALTAGLLALAFASSPTPARAEPPDLEAAFRIDGMACGSCAARLSDVLSKTNGVREATVDFDAATAYVRFDPGALSAADVERVIDATGFDGALLPHHLRFIPVPAMAVGDKARAELVLGIGQADAYVHPDAPFEVTVEGGEGLSVEKTTLVRADAHAAQADGKDRLLSLSLPLTARGAGVHTLRARVRFFFCTPGSCTRKSASTATRVKVTRDE